MAQIYGIYNYGSDDGIFCGRQCNNLYAYLDMKFAEMGANNNGGQIQAVANEVHQMHQDIHTLATKQDVDCAAHHIIHHVECARDEITDKLEIFEKIYAECGDINQQVQDIHKHCCC